MKKKLILAGTVLMGAGLALAGCGDSSKTSDGKTKIRNGSVQTIDRRRDQSLRKDGREI